MNVNVNVNVNVFIKKKLIHGKNLCANYEQKHTVKLYKLKIFSEKKEKKITGERNNVSNLLWCKPQAH